MMPRSTVERAYGRWRSSSALAIAWQYRAPLVGRVWCFEDIAAYFVPLYTRGGARDAHGAASRRGTSAPGRDSRSSAIRSSGCFYPPNWLWMMMNPTRLYAWLQLFHVAVGAGGMWALARARGRSTAAAALAALTLGAAARSCVLELRHAMFVATTAWLPWLLWGIERWRRSATVDERAVRRR